MRKEMFGTFTPLRIVSKPLTITNDFAKIENFSLVANGYTGSIIIVNTI